MASDGLSADNVGALRVVDLKEELKARGLATDGKKVRLMGAIISGKHPHQVVVQGSS